jgi:hypothetical protein
MSLVSEALRKARAESMAGGARPRGVVFRTTVVLGARGPRIGLGWLLGGAALAAAAAGGAVAWWLLPGRGVPAPVPVAASVTASTAAAGPAAHPAASAPAPMAAEVNPATHENPAVAAPPAAVETAAGRAAASEPAPALGNGAVAATAPAPGAAQPSRPPAVAERQALPVVAAQERPKPAPDAVRQLSTTAAAGGRERAFGLDADLGYAKLHLDYIVYRSKAPFAGINGQQVTIGSVIEGFTVEEIGPDSIRLHDSRGDVILQIPH